MLPIRTTLADVDTLCGYLITKPTGATGAKAKAVRNEKVLDGRKLSAMKTWGLIEERDAKMRLTERGRLISKDKGAKRSQALKEAIGSIRAYVSIIERAVHRSEHTFTGTEVAAHWHQHFKDDASDSDRILNDQAVCFFQLAEGADLGKLIIGRKGQPTRFVFDEMNAHAFVTNSELATGVDDEDVSQEDSVQPLSVADPPVWKSTRLRKYRNLAIGSSLLTAKTRRYLNRLRSLSRLVNLSQWWRKNVKRLRSQCPTKSWTRCDRAMLL